MEQPPGFQQLKGNGSLVCKLNKAIYGLKQAPRAWSERLQNFLISSGFVFSKADCSLFLKFTNEFTLFVLVSVDDIIITGSSYNETQSLTSHLNAQFSRGLKGSTLLSWY